MSTVETSTGKRVEPQTVYEKSQDIVWRRIGEESILVPVRREVGELDSVYSLNETAAFIWSQIDGKKTVAEIRESLLAEFEVGEQQAAADLDRCLKQFIEIACICKAPSVA